MKSLLRAIFSPLLSRLESGEGDYVYRRSHRVILLVVSGLFFFLASLSVLLAPSADYLFPVLIFGGAGVIGLVVGWVGEDVAVARLWGSRKDV